MYYIALLFDHKGKIIDNTDSCNKLAVESHIKQWLEERHSLDNVIVLRAPLSSLHVVVKTRVVKTVEVDDGRR